jgi:Domain of unknown function (DUF1707)
VSAGARITRNDMAKPAVPGYSVLLTTREKPMTAGSTIRVTHHEREKAVEGLRAAYALGCLDEDELEERSTLAYAAKTRGDLADLVSDLPVLPPAAPAASGATDRRSGWLRRVRRSLRGWGWLVLAAAGAWVIVLATGGILAVPLISLWLAGVRGLHGRMSPRP